MNQAGRYRRLRSRLTKSGWRIVKRGGHYIAYAPDGRTRPIPIACSPDTGSKTHQGLTHQLRKAGFTEDW